MKRIALLLAAAALAFSLAACAEQKSVDEQFMDSLASGLEARWALTDADENKDITTKEDWEGYFDAEYNEISQFEDTEFEDKNLGKWAKKYIESIAASKDALKYFNTNQWDAKYHNDIYQNRVIALYKINAITPVPISEDRQEDLDALLTNGEMAEAAANMLKNVKFKKTDDDGYGWRTYSAVVENTTSNDFSNFTFTIDLIDEEGVTIETQHAYADEWAAGEKARFEFQTDTKFKKMEVVYTEWYF